MRAVTPIAAQVSLFLFLNEKLSSSFKTENIELIPRRKTYLCKSHEKREEDELVEVDHRPENVS